LPVAVTHGGDIFAIARERNWDWREVLDFSASINPLGAAPGVRPAICQALERIGHYPEREPARLRQALAAAWTIHENQILLGNGATELIYFLVRILQPKRVVLAAPVFSEFHRAFPAAHLVDLQDTATWPQADLLVLTRPANPTGWSVDLRTLEQFLQSHSHPVLVDESFLEYSALPSASTLLSKHPQLIILRSLTKFYALPGLRVGALIAAAQWMTEWRRWREPWQVNVLAEEAALAALADREHAERSLEWIQSERKWLSEQLKALKNVAVQPSDANFLYVRTRYPAQRICDYLQDQKILIRNCAGWPGLSGEAVRVAVRTRPENERLLQAWRNFQCD
jgi:threonine-phosphate decarboxylase